jgi:hypothetical protein
LAEVAKNVSIVMTNVTLTLMDTQFANIMDLSLTKLRGCRKHLPLRAVLPNVAF